MNSNSRRRRLSELAPALAMLALGASCASSSEVRVLHTGTMPRTIAVLEPEGGNLTPWQRTILRRWIGSLVEERGYVKLSDDYVDESLSTLLTRPWDEASKSAETSGTDGTGGTAGTEGTDGAGAANGGHDPSARAVLPCDAVLKITGFVDSTLQAGVAHERSLEGQLLLLDVRSGERLMEVHTVSSKGGGAIFGSSQLVRALIDTFEIEEQRHFILLAGKAMLDLHDGFPMSPAPGLVRSRPRVERVGVTRAEDDPHLLQFAVRATAGCQAFLNLPDRLIKYPLEEMEPGVYAARIRLAVPVASDTPSRVQVFLRDPVGVTSRLHDEAITP